MTSTFLKHLITVILFIATLSGCATSGGGSPARFTSQNSQEIVLSPFYLSDPSVGGDHAWYMKLNISDKIPVAGFLKPNQMLMESFTRWMGNLKPVAGQVLNVSDSKQTEGCAGSYAGQIEVETEGQFKGTLSFADYADECSLVLSGKVPFQGKMDMSSGETLAELSLEQLRAKLAEKPLQFAGNVQLKFNALKGEKQAISAESRLSLSDESGLRFGLTPMLFTWDRRGEYIQSTIEGRVVIPPYGMVRLTTLSPMQLRPVLGSKPFDGSLRFIGADDSWIRLLFPKPGAPGFFRIDGSDGMETIGQL